LKWQAVVVEMKVQLLCAKFCLARKGLLRAKELFLRTQSREFGALDVFSVQAVKLVCERTDHLLNMQGGLVGKITR
jgi:hypothetical protein